MTKTAQDLKKGDEVSWKWGGGEPSGTVEDVVEGDATVQTKKGNTVSRKGGKYFYRLRSDLVRWTS